MKNYCVHPQLSEVVIQDSFWTPYSEATLIPYYKRNNRFDDNPLASSMAVWFPKENIKNAAEIQRITGSHLYGYYGLY